MVFQCVLYLCVIFILSSGLHVPSPPLGNCSRSGTVITAGSWESLEPSTVCHIINLSVISYFILSLNFLSTCFYSS